MGTVDLNGSWSVVTENKGWGWGGVVLLMGSRRHYVQKMLIFKEVIEMGRDGETSAGVKRRPMGVFLNLVTKQTQEDPGI